MALTEYQRKRHFAKTPEPAGKVIYRRGALRFVIQKHAASHLHYDFRLEWNGVLKSWAVPKGPSLDPKEIRLAVEVEDHPIDYGNFEGTIPQGQYGGGTVLLWDQGTWEPVSDVDQGLRQGKLTFALMGKKLKGIFSLVRTKSKEHGKTNWLLIKGQDAEARSLTAYDILKAEPASVKTGRLLEEIAAGAKRPSTSPTQSHRFAAHDTSAKSKRPIKKSMKALPAVIEPALATLVEEPPMGEGWLHEIKFDGYRMLCRVEGEKVTFVTRNQLNWASRLPGLVAQVQQLPIRQAVMDGEVVALDAHGVSSFQKLQNAFQKDSQASLDYYVFDLLWLDGEDLRPLPLIERKQRLAKLLQSKPIEHVHYTDHVVGNGPETFRESRRMSLEGILSKRVDSPYPRGRTLAWQKSKCVERDGFVIGGFTNPSGTRVGLGALLLGYYDSQGTLTYAGRVGTGFDIATLRELVRQLKALRQKDSPFGNLSVQQAGAGVHFVRPTLVTQIEFTNWTEDGLLRHPVFLGLREDIPATAVHRPVAKSVPKTTRASHTAKKTSR